MTRSSSFYSFSGSDCRIWTYFEGFEQFFKEVINVQTISYSIHQSKLDVYSLGSVSRSGVTTGFRKYAGSLILTVNYENPLTPWLENLKEVRNFQGRGRNFDLFSEGMHWSIDKNINGAGAANPWSKSSDGLLNLNYFSYIAPALPPSNIVVHCMTELPVVVSGTLSSETIKSTPGSVSSTMYKNEDGGALNADFNLTTAGSSSTSLSTRNYSVAEGASFMIRGIEFLDEGLVVSVHDTLTEITLSFTADEVKPLSQFGVQVAGDPKKPLTEEEIELIIQSSRDSDRTAHDNLVSSLFTGSAKKSQSLSTPVPEAKNKAGTGRTDSVPGTKG